MKWSNLKGQQWGGATLPLQHDGEFFNIEMKVLGLLIYLFPIFIVIYTMTISAKLIFLVSQVGSIRSIRFSKNYSIKVAL